MSTEVTLVLPVELVYVVVGGMVGSFGIFIRTELRTRSQSLDIGAIKKCIKNIEDRLGIVAQEAEVAKEGVADHERDIGILMDRTAGMRKSAV